MREHDFEPVRGLPENLPEGERILWQGAPSARRLAQEAFHVRAAGAYLLAMLGWRAVSALADGAGLAKTLLGVLEVAPIGVAALAILYLLAFVNSRSTVYTITNRRVVMRFGAAVPKAINIPFRLIDKAGVDVDASGRGDLVLTLTDENRIAFLHLWPHVRPFRFKAAEPTFRGLEDAAAAAEILAAAVDAEIPISRTSSARPRRPQPRLRPDTAQLA